MSEASTMRRDTAAAGKIPVSTYANPHLRRRT